MAIRKRQERASPWQCYWNNPYTGKREAANFATEEEAKKHDSLIKHRLRFERESFRDEDAFDKQDTEITLERAYLLYLREKQFTKSGLSWQLQSMRLALKMFGEKPIAQITTEDFAVVMQAHAARNVKQTTVRNRMAVFRAVLRWSANKGFCDLIRLPKLPNARSEQFIPPTPDELSAMLQMAEPHIQRVIILGAQCGARIGPSELFRLTWDDIDMRQKIIRIHGAKKNPGAP